MAEHPAPQTFETMAPTITRYAQARLRCPDLQAVALVLAWHFWRTAGKPHLPASTWARCGVRAALAGRDLPGLQSKFRDAWKRRETQGAGMEGLADRRPGPERVAVAREECDKFFASLSEFDKKLCDLLGDGTPNHVVAKRLDRTAGCISQHRRKLMEQFRDQ